MSGIWQNHKAKKAVRNNDPTYIDESPSFDRDDAYVRGYAWDRFEDLLDDDDIYEAARTAAYFLDEDAVYDHVHEAMERTVVRQDPGIARTNRLVKLLDAFNIGISETDLLFTDDELRAYVTGTQKAEKAIGADLLRGKRLAEMELAGPHFYFVDADTVRSYIEDWGDGYQADFDEYENVENEADIYVIRDIDWVRDLTTEDIREHVEL